MSRNIKSPSFANRLLRLFCPEDLYEEVKGDLEETYAWRKDRSGVTNARYRYYLDVFSAIRFMKTQRRFNGLSQIMMFSFIKSSFRNFNKHKFQTGLNVFGLAAGMAAALFILEYVSDEMNYDRFVQSKDTYRVGMSFNRGDELMYKTAVIGEPIAKAMVDELPQVEKSARLLDITRIWEGKNILSIENESKRTFEEPNLYFADPEIIDLFDLKLAYGSSRLDEPNTIILSSETAKKYFGGSQAALGKVIKFQSVRKKHELLVTGVYNLPSFNLQVKPTGLVSYATNLEGGKNSIIPIWGLNSCLTYIKVKSGTQPEALDESLNGLLRKHEPINKKSQGQMHIGSLLLSPVNEIHLNSTYQDEVGSTGDVNTIIALFIIAFFIVSMAWINYINLSTANSMRRSKEVGVRKVMGARKSDLVFQFFTETFLINLIALALAISVVLLSQTLFNQFIDRSLHLLSIDFSRFGLVLALIFFSGVLVSGVYAALILSTQTVTKALKGISKGNSGKHLRRGLITFQLLFSSLLIISSFVFQHQLQFMNNSDLGVNLEKLLVIEGPTIKSQDSLHSLNSQLLIDRLSRMSNVKAVSVSNSIPGQPILQSNSLSRDNTVSSERHNIEVVVGNDYLDVLDVNLLAGTGFETNVRGEVILNSAAINQLGFNSPEDAIGEVIYNWFRGADPRVLRIRGVIDDYHHESLNRKVDPMIFFSDVGRWDNFYLLKLENERSIVMFEELEQVYAEVFPDNPIEYYFLDQFFNRQYRNDKLSSRIFGAFVLIAILIACLGLYGLTSFVALQRTKEVGVRKVFGAKLNGLLLLLSKEVLVLSGIAFLLATPLAYYGAEKWLDNYAYHINLSWWLFLLPMLMVLCVAILAIGSKVLRTARINPIKSLRYE